MPTINFPLYRKTPNEKSFYKIIDSTTLLEIQTIGTNYLKHELHAKIFPEKMLIQDLIENSQRHWKNIEEKEFDVVYQRFLSENSEE